MKVEVLDLYNHLLDYCKENELMITNFNIQKNVFQKLEITITDDCKEQIYSIKIPEQSQVHYLLPENENIHGTEIQNIINLFIY